MTRGVGLRRWSLTGLILLVLAVALVASPWMRLWLQALARTRLDRYMTASLLMSLLIGVCILFGGLGAFKGKVRLSLIGGGLCLVGALLYRVFSAIMGAWRGVDIWLAMAGVFMLIDGVAPEHLKSLTLRGRKKGMREEAKPRDPFEELLDRLRALDEELERLWRTPGHGGLEAKLMEARRVRMELHRMALGQPQLQARLRREAYNTEPLRRLLEVFLGLNVEGMDPTIQAGKIIYKPAMEALDVNPSYVLEQLERLAEEEILVKKFRDKVLTCPRCGYYSEVIMHYKCPKCASRDIDAVKLLEHLTCGTVHEKSRYAMGGSGYTCPKCGAEVNLDALRVVGVTYKCNSCLETFSDPLQYVYCGNCGGEFSLKEADFTNTYTYALNPRVREEAVAAIYTSALASILAEEGFRVEAPALLKGRSGLPMEFTMAAEKDGLKLAIDLLHSDRDAGLSEVLPSTAKFSDLDDVEPILVAIPGLRGEAMEFASSKGVNCIAGAGLEEVKAKLKGLLQALGRA
ncbi:MAG: hypothetical protein QW176_07730 [Candidatus Bathyarchaeia archaeon]